MEQRLSMRWKNLTKWYTVMRNSNVWMCAEVNDSRKGKHWLSNSRAVTSLILSCFRCRAPPSHTEKAVWFLLTKRENQSVSLGNKWNGPSSTCCLSGLSFFSPLKMHLFLLHVYECFVSMYASGRLQVYLEPTEARRKYWVPPELDLGSVVSHHVGSRSQT